MFFPIEMYEFQEAAPTLLSLALMELMLSTERLLEVSEGVSHLPKQRRPIALHLGGALADLARLAGLLLAAPFVSHFVWAKCLGALYLLEMMSAHFVQETRPGEDPATRSWSLPKTVLQVALLDLSYSIGNLVAALSLTRTVWIVCLSTIFWMIFTRLFARPILALTRRSPLIANTVPILAGTIGLLILIEVMFQSLGKIAATPWQQFGGLVAILSCAVLYDTVPAVRNTMQPLFRSIGMPLMRVLNRGLSMLFWPLRAALGHLVAR